MTTVSESPIYYDPFDIEIDKDPHPVWRRMRDEAPLWCNERHDFWALSRFDDVEGGHEGLGHLPVGQGVDARLDQGRHRAAARGTSSWRTRRATTSTGGSCPGCSRRSG